ncbi:MAG: nucleotidyltransferase family protein [candidate division Zixibacteria bacterium]|nr:nucleotidyltransferase family protein [candidate division Zixibacteria bacterium]
MEAVILAGGKGTRLYPHTSDIPKPLLPIGDQPIIEIVLLQLKRAGVNKVHIAVNHLAHLIMDVIGDGTRFGLAVSYVIEESPLSTVGPLANIQGLPEDFIVINGDILTDLDIALLFADHLSSGAEVTVATHQRTEKIDYGVLETDANGRVVRFSEKPDYTAQVSMGVYIFSHTILDRIPAGKPYGFDTLMTDMLLDGGKICAYSYTGYWLDVGRPDDYQKAHQDIGLIASWFSKP